MGYYTRFDGEITINPPIPWGEIKDSPFAKGSHDCDHDVRFRIEEQETDQPDGTLIRKQAVAVVCTYEDEAKAYSIVQHLQKLLDDHGAGRTFTGYIEAEGEEAGDQVVRAVRPGRADQAPDRVAGRLMNSWFHAQSCARKWGGEPEIYLPVHEFIDSSKAVIGDVRHRSMYHHTLGVYLCQRIFGDTLQVGRKRIPVRLIAERHIIEDLGWLPSPADYLNGMPISTWMGGKQTKTVDLSTLNLTPGAIA